MKLSLLNWVDRGHIALGTLSGFCILAIMLIVTPDVIARKAISWTIPGASELNTLLLVSLIYIGLAGAQARGTHYRVTILTDKMSPAMQRASAVFTTILTIGFIGLLAWFTTQSALKSFSNGEMTFGVIAFPVWPSRIAIALGLSLLLLQHFVELARLIFNEAPRPYSDTKYSP